jgi:hypothetical protein
MDSERYKQFLLASIPGAKLVSGGSHINCRCRECPDSRNINSAHMYISIPKNNNEPSLYYCHKCNCKGIVKHTTLIDWGIFDKDIAMELDTLNKIVAKNPKYKGLTSFSAYNLYNDYTNIDEVSEYKRKYICDRVGVDLSYKDLQDLKIILNISDLFRTNRITHYSRADNILEDVDKYFLGFISIDNGFINMRRTIDEGKLYKSIDKRYINYQIFDKDITTHRFYTIPTTVNLNQGPVKLHISEGPFDILSVYLNCRHREPGVYTCIAGNNYSNIINFFTTNFMMPFVELHFYPDNDKYGTNNRINYILDHILDPVMSAYIHRNTYSGEKDFGVPATRIAESIQRIR